MISKAHKLSNQWIRKHASNIRGRVLSIGSRDDLDGEGKTYRSYFVSADQYFTSEPTSEFNCNLLLDVRSMPEIKTASFNCVFCSGVLEHINRLNDAVKEIVRILKPSGKLLLGVPFRQPIHLAPDDYWRFTEYGIKELLGQNGMVVEKINPIDAKEQNFPATYWIQASKVHHPEIEIIEDYSKKNGLFKSNFDIPTTGQPVHIVLADRGWILERCGLEIAKRLTNVSMSNIPDEKAQINYYINYSAFQNKTPGLDIAFFTHIEDDPEASDRFFDVAQQMDYRICMANRYANRLKQKNMYPTEIIVPGVDTKLFTPLLRVGVVGRTYHTGRKGEKLVQALINEPNIEWRFTHDGWPGPAHSPSDSEMPNFYRALDVLLVPSLIEGGPMPILEALACGVEIIAPDVGFVPDYPHYPYRTGDIEDLRRVLHFLVERKLSLSRTVANRTWEAWAQSHDQIFKKLLSTNLKSKTSEDQSPDAPKKVLFCLHAPESEGHKGGPSIRLRQTAKALLRLGVEVDITTENQPDVKGYDIIHIFNIWSPNEAVFSLRHARLSGKPVVFSPIYMPLEETTWASIVVPNILSTEDEENCKKNLSNLAKNKLLWQGVSREIGLPPFHDWYEKLLEMNNNSDHLVFLSHFERHEFQKLCGKTTQWSLVHNGVDFQQFANATKDLFSKEYQIDRYVLCVGRIEPRKNQALLARSMRDLDIDLVLIGNASNQKYKELILKQNHRVKFIDYIESNTQLLASAYAGAECLALPSWVEGAPLVALEAAAAGCPMVLSNRSGEMEYFGGLAEYCDPASIDSIRTAVTNLLFLNPNKKIMMIQGLKSLTRFKWTWEATGKATLSAYQTVLKQWKHQKAKIETISSQIRRLEIGSGERPTAGYEHLDVRPGLPDLDYIHDTNHPLPFTANTFNEILSHSNVEHYSWHRVIDILRDWLRVLKPGGKLAIWMPDFEYICRMYLQGKDDLNLDPSYREMAQKFLGGYTPSAWALIKTFGGQEYEGNFHYASYDFATFKQILESAGYIDIQRLEPYDGLKTEAYKPIKNQCNSNNDIMLQQEQQKNRPQTILPGRHEQNGFKCNNIKNILSHNDRWKYMAELSSLENEVQRLKTVYQTRSWKITQPLRSLNNFKNKILKIILP